MTEPSNVQTYLVALIDGMWWGLRDNVGPLSMYEGYARGFKQIGIEAAKKQGGKGAVDAAKIAGSVLADIGLTVEVKGTEIFVKSCPIWNRIKERGLEYSFHIEEIGWKPLLEGIGEVVGAKPVVETSLRLNYLAAVKLEYKLAKAKKALEAGSILANDYAAQEKALRASIDKIPKEGRYRYA
jgi:hypothetical protein